MTNYKNIKKLGLCIIAFDDTCHLYNIISELRDAVDYVSIGLLEVSYHGDPISNIDLQEIIRLRDEDHLVDNIVNIKLNLNDAARVLETAKRNILILDALDHGCTHCICIDSDEYYTKKSFEEACKKIDANNYPITYCQYINYYHDYMHFLVYPFKDGMHVPFVTRVEYRHSFDCTDFTLPSDPTRRFVRPYDGVKKVQTKDGKIHEIKNYTVDYYVFPWNEIKMHHLSWLRSNIRKKLNVWSSKKCFNNFNDLIDKSVASFNKFDESKEKNEALMLFNTPGNKVDVKAFPKQYIHPKVDFRTRLRKYPDYKRIVVLSMSADIPIFNTLEKASNETWKLIDKSKFKNCDKIEFWTYTDTDNETYVDKENHIIYVKREPLLDIMDNNHVYRTFSKTITALHELNKVTEYDYLIRTNNSTWLNIPLLNLFLSYVDDDSLVFGGTLYSMFWSAFNLYAGGNLMIFSKRNIEILLDIAKTPIEIENLLLGADDNIIFGLLNHRLVKLELSLTDYYHSIGEYKYYNKDIPVKCSFEYPAYQIKTFDVSDEDRIEYDIKKMYALQKLFNESDITDDKLENMYQHLMEEYYDKSILILPISKQEYFATKDNIKIYELTQTYRDDVIKHIPEYLKTFGYKVVTF